MDFTRRDIQLDEQSLALFSQKGAQGGPHIVQQGLANGLKVRRVMQIASDLLGSRVEDASLLDLACGEGVYSIEAAIHGATVTAIDGRTQRMAEGQAVATRHGLSRIRWEQADIRKLSRDTHGVYDVVLFLGILYHLDAPDVFGVLRNVFHMATRAVVIDTHVAQTVTEYAEYEGRRYAGTRTREHGDNDSVTERQSHVLMSLDNTYAFVFTRESLVHLLRDIGFTTVFECLAPQEPGKPSDRVTIVALKGQPVVVATYPWVNNASDDEVQEVALQKHSSLPRSRSRGTWKSLLNAALARLFGSEVRRV
jgi:SAM-dependent methyltransferase